jgi:hypothetical protein
MWYDMMKWYDDMIQWYYDNNIVYVVNIYRWCVNIGDDIDIYYGSNDYYIILY